MPTQSDSTSETTKQRGSPTGGNVVLGPGRVLSGRFKIGELRLVSDMGSVYAAHDLASDRDIAIKVLPPELTASAHILERFIAQASVSRQLGHPNIVSVYDVDVSDDHAYIVVERLRGQTLRESLQARGHKPLPLEIITRMARQIIEALDYAQLVRRDIKPENIWLCEDGTVKLMDFGIVRDPAAGDRNTTTRPLGTPHSMATDHWKATENVDWCADQYSLGVMLYEMLTGQITPCTRYKLGARLARVSQPLVVVVADDESISA